ncbi:unnamed protein product [Cylicocyclus nassatus]|uniref:Uncharacterized protein n=1 Tax=Cylicocyclus nassatus TaxID=53992 RepID=A0AA36DTJ6_CYLNA|nr:unnamed protein product [Cylicocyclus nassatus]
MYKPRNQKIRTGVLLVVTAQPLLACFNLNFDLPPPIIGPMPPPNRPILQCCNGQVVCAPAAPPCPSGGGGGGGYAAPAPSYAAGPPPLPSYAAPAGPAPIVPPAPQLPRYAVAG